MQKKALITISGIVVGCAAIILILVGAAQKQLNHINSFNRKWEVSPTFISLKDFKDRISHIMAIDSTKVYMTGRTHGTIYVWDQITDRLDTLYIPLPNDSKFLKGYDLNIDYPVVNATAKNYGGILTYEHRDSGFVLTKIGSLETTLITRSVITSPNTVFLRAFDTSRKYQEFQKLDLTTGRLIATALPFDTKADAGFSSDGKLLYDNSTHRLLYLQYYKNAFYCMDTNLNIIYTGRTIDTVSTGAIQTRKTESKDLGGSLMPSTPLISINKTACIDNGILYVVSLLQADNESVEDFQKNNSIDKYRMDTGEYIGSFKTQNIGGKKLLDFKVKNGFLYAVYPNKLLISKI